MMSLLFPEPIVLYRILLADSHSSNRRKAAELLKQQKFDQCIAAILREENHGTFEENI
jgi:hypothetical protein